MSYGVTAEGFVLKRLADCKTEIENDLKSIFGASIDLAANGPFGQFAGIMAERESLLWELFEQVYNSGYPDTAEGAQLEQVVRFNALVKDTGSFSTVAIKVYGDIGTIVTQGSIISVSGNPLARFLVDEDLTIGAGTDEVQNLAFSLVPDAGSFTLIYDGETTGAIAYNATAAAIKAALEALANVSSVTVTGDFTSGFVVTFTGVDGEQDRELLEVGSSTLVQGVTSVSITITVTTAGELPNAAGTATAESRGATVALTGTLSIMETSITGWDSVVNTADATVGLAPETDAALKLRRALSVSTSGGSTLEGIATYIRNRVEGVTACVVFENDTMSTDGDGRPPKSIEVVVEGGDDADVAEAIWLSAKGGIYLHGSETVVHVDDEGFNQTIRFSRPTPVPIHLIADIDVDSTFPADGETTLRDLILDYGASLESGDDVIVYPKLISVFNDDNLPGILDITIKIGTAALPTLDDNITISNSERSSWDSARITINVTVV